MFWYFRETFDESRESRESRESLDSNSYQANLVEDELEEKILVIDQEKHEM